MDTFKSCNESYELKEVQTHRSKRSRSFQTEESVILLSDADLFRGLTKCDSAIRGSQLHIWRNLEEKRIFISEISRRCDDLINFAPKNLESIDEFVLFNNEILKTFTELYENYFSVLVTTFDQISTHLVQMNEIKNKIGELSNEEIGLEMAVIAQELKKAPSHMQNLADLISKKHVQINSKNLQTAFLEQITGNYDDVVEENKVLKNSLHKQANVILELASENKRLDIIVSANKKHTDHVPESLNMCIEPLRLACGKYENEFKRSIRQLEELVRAAKEENGVLPKTEKPENDLEVNLLRLIQKCSDCIRSLKEMKERSDDSFSNIFNKFEENILFIKDHLERLITRFHYENRN